MKQYTNPFHTLEDVVATLESLGTNPLCKETNWASEIISITAEKRFNEDCTHYYATIVHMNVKGLQEFVRIVEGAYVIGRECLETSNAYDRLELELSDTLMVVALIDSEEEFVWQQ